MNMFDAEKTTTQCVEWIRGYFAENGPDCSAVVGLSGGKDSSVTAALCVRALGRDRVIGVLLPNGVQDDIDYAYLAAEFLEIRYYVLNIQKAYQSVLNSIGEQFPIDGATKLSLPARLRMVSLYAVAQSNNGRVANTCNLSQGDRQTPRSAGAAGGKGTDRRSLRQNGRGQSRLHLCRSGPLYPRRGNRRRGNQSEDRPDAPTESL